VKSMQNSVANLVPVTFCSRTTYMIIEHLFYIYCTKSTSGDAYCNFSYDLFEFQKSFIILLHILLIYEISAILFSRQSMLSCLPEN
jgi:hypothetical protein